MILFLKFLFCLICLICQYLYQIAEEPSSLSLEQLLPSLRNPTAPSLLTPTARQSPFWISSLATQNALTSYAQLSHLVIHCHTSIWPKQLVEPSFHHIKTYNITEELKITSHCCCLPDHSDYLLVSNPALIIRNL